MHIRTVVMCNVLAYVRKLTVQRKIPEDAKNPGDIISVNALDLSQLQS